MTTINQQYVWRPEPESNRRARICSPLRHHSAIGPRVTAPKQAAHGVRRVTSDSFSGNQSAFTADYHPDAVDRVKFDIGRNPALTLDDGRLEGGLAAVLPVQHGYARFLQAMGFMTLLPQSEEMRRNMVDSQLRTSGVNTPWILAAMLATPREAFVSGDCSTVYMDRATSLGEGRMLNPPVATGQMLQLANVQASDHVLLIGDSSGYVAALLANRVASLTAMTEYAAEAPKHGPYSLILIDGAIETLPDSLTAQLADGGRIVTGITDGPVTRLATGVKHGAHLALRPAFDMEIAALPGFARAKEFIF